MSNSSDYIDQVGKLISEVEKLGLEPVLIGGMALILLGSRRVTQDYDFLISGEGRTNPELINIFYKNGFELVSKTNKQGDIISTIDNPRVAAIRLKLDAPSSTHFFNKKSELQIDLLFDFPFLASELAIRAKKKKVRTYSFRVASRADLIRLKKIATEKRSLAADAQDLEFLKKLR